MRYAKALHKVHERGYKTNLVLRKLRSHKYWCTGEFLSADITIYRAQNRKCAIEVKRKRRTAKMPGWKFYMRSASALSLPNGLELGYDINDDAYPYFVREEGMNETSPTDLYFKDVELILQQNMSYEKEPLCDRVILTVPRALLTGANAHMRQAEISLMLEDIYTLKQIGLNELKGVFSVMEWIHLHNALQSAHVNGSIRYMTSILKQYIKDYDALYPERTECSLTRLLDKIDCLTAIHVDAIYTRVAARVADEKMPKTKRETDLIPLEEWAKW